VSITVTITIDEAKPGLWLAVTSDIPDVQYANVPIAVAEDTPSWALGHACEDIVERLQVLREHGKDWQGSGAMTGPHEITFNDMLNSLPETIECQLERAKGLWLARLQIIIIPEPNWSRVEYVGFGQQPVAAIRAAIERWEQDKRLLESGSND